MTSECATCVCLFHFYLQLNSQNYPFLEPSPTITTMKVAVAFLTIWKCHPRRLKEQQAPQNVSLVWSTKTGEKYLWSKVSSDKNNSHVPPATSAGGCTLENHHSPTQEWSVFVVPGENSLFIHRVCCKKTGSFRTEHEDLTHLDPHIVTKRRLRQLSRGSCPTCFTWRASLFHFPRWMTRECTLHNK